MSKTVVNRRRLAIIIGVFVVIAVIIAIAVPLALTADDDDDDDDNKADIQDGDSEAVKGFDCYPEAEGDGLKVNETTCTQRGCTFSSTPSTGHHHCEYNRGQYRLEVSQISDTPLGFEATLNSYGPAPFGGNVEEWLFTFENRGNDVVHFKFDTSDGKRYKVPKQMALESVKGTEPKYSYKFTRTENDRFSFQIIRSDTGTVVWDVSTAPGSLILSNQFLQITTKLPSTNVYGLGEHVHSSLRHDMTKTWPSFSRDQPPSFDDEANLYGVHPFYTCVEDGQGNTHGVLMLNSNAQEYAFTDLPSLTFRTIGGILDFYVFMGPTPEQVIQQYTGVIGRPMLPPYWSLGFQLCRYGYNNISNLIDAVETTAKYDIPHDVQYVDIDHMDTQKIFTINHEAFPGLNDYFHTLRDQGMRIIYILDPCLISNETNYRPYEVLKQIGGYIKWGNNVTIPEGSADTDGSILGYVWPEGKTVFPDFMKTSVREKWKDLIVEHRNELVFDGLWIDMNEPANFGTNEDRPWNWPEDAKPYWSLKCPENDLEDPPYLPKAARRWGKRISDKTLCMSAVQGEQGQYKQYDVHSLFGWSQTEPTLYAAQTATGERSVVISRSTFPGSGQYAGHWLGDNVSAWKDLHSSIIGILEFNLFGIPYIGADICGFFDHTTPELCKRWMQLGAFYTFSRNHNTLGQTPQGPGQLGDEVGYASRDIMRIRYDLLPYLYCLFYEAHTKGSTVIRPVHHEFPDDRIALGVDTQFLWGNALLISPILEQGQTELTYYLPKGRWFKYPLDLIEGEPEIQSVGSKKSIPITQDSIPLLHIRGGTVIPTQKYANNTHFSRQNEFTIIAALDENGHARGSFFWDDGVAINNLQSGDYIKASFLVDSNQFRYTVDHKPAAMSGWDDLVFDKIYLLGMDSSLSIDNVFVDGNPLSNLTKQTQQTVQAVHAQGLNKNIRESFTIAWS